MPLTFYLCLYFITLVSVIGIVKYKHLSNSLRFIEWYVVSSVISAWIEHVLGSYYHIHTLWLFHFNTFIELLLVLFALYHWRSSELNGKLLKWSFYVYAIVWIVGMFTFEPLTMSDDYSGSISQLIQLGFSIWLLFTVLEDDSVIWKNDPRFWVASGIILYCASTFFLFSLFDVLLSKSSQMLRTLTYLNWWFIILTYIFYLRAFLCKPASAGIITFRRSK